ncbi:DUF2127 domain-containing protein [Luteimonas sp. SDU101]|uniref:DUF2127 domain-containing protein n=1 Tax=Luteimonas sp. SDU101 TaxID=3422593 RepID=UPI003EBFD040
MDAAPSIAVAADAARPELRAIALFEAGKGVLSLVAASALAVAGPAPLQQSVLVLLARLRGGQVPVPPAWLKVPLNPDSVRLAVAAIAAYGLLRLLEAWGLWRAHAWASWLGCVSAALYLPFELHALIRHPGWLALSVLAVNLVVVAVLGRDLLRRRA